MKKIIAACGNDCSVCPRYVAHPYEKTNEELRHTAELWLKIGYRDRIVSNEEISCKGCRSENWCRYRVIIVNVFNILTLDDYLSKMHCIVGSGK